MEILRYGRSSRQNCRTGRQTGYFGAPAVKTDPRARRTMSTSTLLSPYPRGTWSFVETFPSPRWFDSITRSSQSLFLLEASNGTHIVVLLSPETPASVADCQEITVSNPDTHHVWMGTLEQARSKEVFRKLGFLALDLQDSCSLSILLDDPCIR